jgi:hypothetical protein
MEQRENHMIGLALMGAALAGHATFLGVDKSGPGLERWAERRAGTEGTWLASAVFDAAALRRGARECNASLGEEETSILNAFRDDGQAVYLVSDAPAARDRMLWRWNGEALRLVLRGGPSPTLTDIGDARVLSLSQPGARDHGSIASALAGWAGLNPTTWLTLSDGDSAALVVPLMAHPNSCTTRLEEHHRALIRPHVGQDDLYLALEAPSPAGVLLWRWDAQGEGLVRILH